MTHDKDERREEVVLTYDLLRLILHDFVKKKDVMRKDVELIVGNTRPRTQEKSAGILLRRGIGGTSEASSRLLLPVNESSPDYIKVEMQLNGYLIPYAVFDMKLSKSKKKSRMFKTTARQPKHPIVIPQCLELHELAKNILRKIQEFDNFEFIQKIEQAIGTDDLIKVGLIDSDVDSVLSEKYWTDLNEEELDNLIPELFKDYLDARAEQKSDEGLFRVSAKPFLDFVESVLGDVKTALHIITQPSVHDFPYVLPRQSMSVQPALPEDLFLQIFLRNESLYVASYLVSTEDNSSKSTKKKKTRKKMARSRQALNYSMMMGTEQDMDLVGSIYESYSLCRFERKKIEVLDQVVCAFDILTFKEDLERWREAFLILKNLKQNLNAHIQVESFTRTDSADGISSEKPALEEVEHCKNTAEFVF